MPERPFVLVGQQYLADPTRSVGNIHPLWTYAHVPHAYTGDATEAITAQIERFAPGFRERIIGTAVRSDDGDVGVQPELCRWRHHRRCVLAETAPVPAAFPRSTRTSPASRVRICAPRRHRRARERTGCAAPTPPPAPWHVWERIHNGPALEPGAP